MRLTQRSRVIGLLAVGLVCLAGRAAPMQWKAGKSGGGDSLDTYVTWPSAPDARGYSERNVTLTVNHDPGGATSNYYWASQFWFNSAATGGYTGLQTARSGRTVRWARWRSSRSGEIPQPNTPVLEPVPHARLSEARETE